MFIAYGLGHMFNDACAIMWFMYGLFFLKDLTGADAQTSGLVVFAGQIADAVATPLAGILSDATPAGCPGGRRRGWMFLGSVVVVYFFPRFFCPAVAAIPVRSAVAASLFNVGWALVQVNHLALAPDLGGGDKAQLRLSTIRQVATVAASAGPFVLVHYALARLGVEPEPAEAAWAFHEVARVVTCVGAVTTSLCLVFVGGGQSPASRRSQRVSSASRDAAMGAPSPGGSHIPLPTTPPMALREVRAGTSGGSTQAAPLGRWLGEAEFWRVGCLYTCARLAVNLPASYVPLVMVEVLHRPVHVVARMPIVMFVGQVLALVRPARGLPSSRVPHPPPRSWEPSLRSASPWCGGRRWCCCSCCASPAARALPCVACPTTPLWPSSCPSRCSPWPPQVRSSSWSRCRPTRRGCARSMATAFSTAPTPCWTS